MRSKFPQLYRAPKTVQNRAIELRHSETEAEKRFWEILRNRNIAGLKFRRQHPIGWFIADFYCHELKLVIELDGKIHDLPHAKQKDKKRTAYMEKKGLHLMRFTNTVVFEMPEIITNQIKLYKESLLSAT